MTDIPTMGDLPTEQMPASPALDQNPVHTTEEKNNNGNTATPEAGKALDHCKDAPWQNDHLSESEKMREIKKAKKGAYWAFHATNFLGLHFLFNSTLSLFIAYNILPTKPVQNLMETMAKLATPINAALIKITTPIKKVIQGSNFKQMAEEEIAANIAHSARSRVETACMCIAGFVALWPVKFLEDHRAGFMNTIDHWLHPGRSKEDRQATDIKPEDTPKETWGNLIRARIVGLGAVFAADAATQRVNNIMTYEKGNIDTAVWKWGADTSDKMSKGIRSKLVNFFANKNISLSGIQHKTRPDLLRTINAAPELHKIDREMAVIQEQITKTVDRATQDKLKAQVASMNETFLKQNPHLRQDVERAIFAEQSRLLITKEIALTLLISTVIYISAKAPFMSHFYEKIGLKRKTQTHGSVHSEVEAPLLGGYVPLQDEPDVPLKKRWSKGEKDSPSRATPSPASSYQDSLQQAQGTEAAVSI